MVNFVNLSCCLKYCISTVVNFIQTFYLVCRLNKAYNVCGSKPWFTVVWCVILLYNWRCKFMGHRHIVFSTQLFLKQEHKIICKTLNFRIISPTFRGQKKSKTTPV